MANDPARNPNNIILSTINSGLVLGPSLVPATGRYSIDTLKDIAEGKTSMIPDMNIQIVDVRDCARMHITIMNDPSTDGHRHLSIGAVGKFIDIATMLLEISMVLVGSHPRPDYYRNVFRGERNSSLKMSQRYIQRLVTTKPLKLSIQLFIDIVILTFQISFETQWTR
jgi:nucleoside-diphosphate-sugar epimerase